MISIYIWYDARWSKKKKKKTSRCYPLKFVLRSFTVISVLSIRMNRRRSTGIEEYGRVPRWCETVAIGTNVILQPVLQLIFVRIERTANSLTWGGIRYHVGKTYLQITKWSPRCTGNNNNSHGFDIGTTNGPSPPPNRDTYVWSVQIVSTDGTSY